jgi:thioredoxin reductase (NADPH)
MTESLYDVVIVGAGPCGLACAIEAKKQGLNYIVVDKGTITESVRRYPLNMTFFSSADNIAIGDVPFTSLNLRPSRNEALRYYRKVVDHYELNLSLFNAVESIETAERGFTLQTEKGNLVTRKIVLAIGYYDVPKKMNIPGEDLPHVSHYFDEAFKYTRTNVVVVGGANSAVETSLDLYRNGANVSVVHLFNDFDSTAKYWIVPDIRNRVKNKEVNAYFRHKVTRIDEDYVYVENLENGEQDRIAADFVFLMTGYRPDEEFLQKSGVKLNGEMLIPEINEDTYESNVPGIYMGGSVVGGEETKKIFIENGKLHAIPIMSDIVHQLKEEKVLVG